MKFPLSSSRSIPLDFLRGIAILLVLGVHYNAPEPQAAFLRWVHDWFQIYGGAGVDLFFVLSGFLVAGLLVNEHLKKGRIDARRFLVRRAFKIWPQYYAFILISMALSLIHRDWSRLSSEVPNLLHLQNYLRTPHLHTWSLAVEEHFYLALAAILAFLSFRNTLSLRSVVMVFLGAALIATSSRLYYVLVVHVTQRAADEYTNSRIDTLALGVLLAAVFHFRHEVFYKIAGHRLALGVALCASLAGCWAVNSDAAARLTYGITLRAVASASLFLLIYGPAADVGFLGRIQRWPVYQMIAWIGQSSYGIYLWHIAIARAPTEKMYGILASRFPADFAWVGGFLIWIAAAILGGYLSTKMIEAPFLRLRDKKLAGTVPPPKLKQPEPSALDSAHANAGRTVDASAQPPASEKPRIASPQT